MPFVSWTKLKNFSFHYYVEAIDRRGNSFFKRGPNTENMAKIANAIPCHSLLVGHYNC